MLENKALWAVKLHNMDASLVALERKYILLELEEYRFHAYETERLYKAKANNAKAVVKFMQCLFTRFDARHSAISDPLNTFRVFSNEFPISLGHLID